MVHGEGPSRGHARPGLQRAVRQRRRSRSGVDDRGHRAGLRAASCSGAPRPEGGRACAGPRSARRVSGHVHLDARDDERLVQRAGVRVSCPGWSLPLVFPAILRRSFESRRPEGAWVAGSAGDLAARRTLAQPGFVHASGVDGSQPPFPKGIGASPPAAGTVAHGPRWTLWSFAGAYVRPALRAASWPAGQDGRRVQRSGRAAAAPAMGTRGPGRSASRSRSRRGGVWRTSLRACRERREPAIARRHGAVVRPGSSPRDTSRPRRR
jgi:hypothetical protein